MAKEHFMDKFFNAFISSLSTIKDPYLSQPP